MNTKNRFLLKNISFFTLANIAPKLIALIMVPLYTQYLSTAEYGIADILITTTLLLLPILTVDIQDAALRFVMDDTYKKQEILSSCFRFVGVGSAILGFALIAVRATGLGTVHPIYLLFIFFYFIGISFFNVLDRFCRGLDLVAHMAAANILAALVALLFNIISLSRHWGLPGYLLANVAGYLAADIYLFSVIIVHGYFSLRKPSRQTMQAMRRFSAPLVFSVIAWWINSVSDRYVVSLLRGVDECGLYSIANKIPIILLALVGALSNAWGVSAIRDFDPEDRDGFIGRTFTLFLIAAVLGCSFLLIINTPLAHLLYAAEFFSAWRFTPPLLVSIVFFGLSLFFGSIFIAVKDTKAHSTSMVIGAVVNVAANLAFVSLWGAIGAALATLLSYAVVAAISLYFLKPHIRMRTQVKKHIAALLLLLLQMTIACLRCDAYIEQALLFACLLLLYHKEMLSLIALIGDSIKHLQERRQTPNP